MGKVRKNLALAAAALMLAAPVSAGLGSAVGSVVDAFRPHFMRYEEFRMDKFLPLGCTSRAQNADINGDSIPEHITLCGSSDATLVIASSEKEGYGRHELRFQKTTNSIYVMPRGGRKELLLPSGEHKAVMSNEELRKRFFANTVWWSGNGYETHTEPFLDYTDKLAREENTAALLSLWSDSNQLSVKSCVERSLRDIEPVKMLDYLINVYGLHEGPRFVPLFDCFEDRLKVRGVSKAYGSDRDALASLRLSDHGEQFYLHVYFRAIPERDSLEGRCGVATYTYEVLRRYKENPAEYHAKNLQRKRIFLDGFEGCDLSYDDTELTGRR